MARLKKPTGLKELHGTARPDRANPNEPRPPVEMPDAPAWIDEDPVTRELFDQVTRYVTDMNIATQVDGLALSMLADQVSLYVETRNLIRRQGLFEESEGSQGQIVKKAHPGLPILNQCLGNIHKLLREYGLTAASRSNVSAKEEKEVNTFQDFINGGDTK
jgi:P27 family predicted phage terminase small subunit